MLNFMCQLDWVTGCPNIQLNVLGVSMECFWMRLTFELVDWAKCLPSVCVCVCVCVCVLVAQSCPTLCEAMDCSSWNSSVHGILQARILEWVAIPFSRWYPWSRGWTRISCITRSLFTVWASREACIMWVSLIQSVEVWWAQSLKEHVGRVRENLLSWADCLWAGTSVFSCLQTQTRIGTYTISIPGSQVLGHELELYQGLP